LSSSAQTEWERHSRRGIDREGNAFAEKTMHGILQLTLAIPAVFVSALPLHAQSNSALRPGTDHSVTTGIGSSSSFKNVPPPPGLPPPAASRAPFWYMPGTYDDEKPRDGDAARPPTEPAPTAPPPPAAEVKENPRTMITRDRIESPQH
jgi:hypothetical protein